MIEYVTIAGTIALATTITVTPVSQVMKTNTASNNSFISIKNETSPYCPTEVIYIEIDDSTPTDDVIEVSIKGTIPTELCQSKKMEFEWF